MKKTSLFWHQKFLKSCKCIAMNFAKTSQTCGFQRFPPKINFDLLIPFSASFGSMLVRGSTMPHPRPRFSLCARPVHPYLPSQQPQQLVSQIATQSSETCGSVRVSHWAVADVWRGSSSFPQCAEPHGKAPRSLPHPSLLCELRLFSRWLIRRPSFSSVSLLPPPLGTVSP